MTATRTHTNPSTSQKIVIQAGPRNASTDPRTGLRYYRWQGRDLPSVTSIRRMAGLPHGLHQWSLGKVIDYALDHQLEIHDRLKGGDPAMVQVIRHEMRGAAVAERDAAALLGTAVHDAAAMGAALTDVKPEVAPRLRQYLDWLRVSELEILASEFQLFNTTVGYAGSADLLGRLPDGRVVLVDLKTGKGLYTEHALQLMAYLMAEFVGADDIVDDRLTELLHEVSLLAVLHLAEDHWEFRSLRADPATWAAFRGMLTFALWLRDHPEIQSITDGTRKGTAA